MVERERAQAARAIFGAGGSPRLFLVIGVWVALVAVIQLYAWREQISPAAMLQGTVAVCREHALGPLLFIGAATLSPLLLVPAALLGGLAGVCFGPWLGIAYTLIGCNLSALLTYSLGRMSGHGDGTIARLCDRYGRRITQHPFVSVVLLRLSFLPYDPVNYLIGMLRVRVLTFLLANTLGSLPGVVAIVLAGSAVGRLGDGAGAMSPWLMLGIIALVVLSVALAVGLRRRGAQA